MKQEQILTSYLSWESLGSSIGAPLASGGLGISKNGSITAYRTVGGALIVLLGFT
jgi:hypothetical protein